MKLCPKCNKIFNQVDVQFCNVCGTKLNEIQKKEKLINGKIDFPPIIDESESSKNLVSQIVLKSGEILLYQYRRENYVLSLTNQRIIDETKSYNYTDFASKTKEYYIEYYEDELSDIKAIYRHNSLFTKKLQPSIHILGNNNIYHTIDVRLIDLLVQLTDLQPTIKKSEIEISESLSISFYILLVGVVSSSVISGIIYSIWNNFSTPFWIINTVASIIALYACFSILDDSINYRGWNQDWDYVMTNKDSKMPFKKEMKYK